MVGSKLLRILAAAVAVLVGSLRGGNGERPLLALISYHQVSQKTGRKRDVSRRKISSRSPNGLNDLWIGTAIFGNIGENRRN